MKLILSLKVHISEKAMFMTRIMKFKSLHAIKKLVSRHAFFTKKLR